MEIKKQESKQRPFASDKYKGAKDSDIKIILIDKDNKQTIIKR